jgi:dihydroorotate dehydrogenase
MLRIVEEIRGHVGSGLAINACGGISTGDDALAALWAGANTVQLYTGFVYRGPGVARGINRRLLRFMEGHGIPSAGEIPALSARERG